MRLAYFLLCDRTRTEALFDGPLSYCAPFQHRS